jgi:dihydropteroate synthase
VGVRLVAVLNVSPESFYAGSVTQGAEAIRDACRRHEDEGAHAIDIGAMSTAPYKETRITPEEESDRIRIAITAAREATNLPITADTSRASVARVALDAGAYAINDVHGLHADPELASLIAERRCGAILMANASQLPAPTEDEEPIAQTMGCLRQCLRLADAAGIDRQDICLDPGIGFFRGRSIPGPEWDMALMRRLDAFRELGLPILVGASRKSFIGHWLDRPDPADRLAGSLAAAIHAAQCGARLIRTHDVASTRDALRMMGLISGAT